MKLKSIKRTVGALLMATIIAGIVGTTTQVQAANNWRDTDFSFTMKNKMKYTSARAKKDSSKIYMKCKTVSKEGATYTAHAIGTNSTKKTGVDCSRGYTYVFGAGTSRYMTNWVYENGYKYARIGAMPNYSYKFVARGVWSPDNKNKK